MAFVGSHFGMGLGNTLFIIFFFILGSVLGIHFKILSSTIIFLFIVRSGLPNILIEFSVVITLTPIIFKIFEPHFSLGLSFLFSSSKFLKMDIPFAFAAIKKTIKNLKNKITIISIAHRLSTIKNCDCIFLIQDGEIILSGDYDSLNEKSPEFRKFSSAQILN